MRVGSVILLALILGAVFFAGSSWWWSMPVPVFVAGLLMSRRARCEHLYPALIPPASNSDGTVVPARWFCCDCGESWSAGGRKR